MNKKLKFKPLISIIVLALLLIVSIGNTALGTSETQQSQSLFQKHTPHYWTYERPFEP